MLVGCANATWTVVCISVGPQCHYLDNQTKTGERIPPTVAALRGIGQDAGSLEGFAALITRHPAQEALLVLRATGVPLPIPLMGRGRRVEIFTPWPASMNWQ